MEAQIRHLDKQLRSNRRNEGAQWADHGFQIRRNRDVLVLRRRYAMFTQRREMGCSAFGYRCQGVDQVTCLRTTPAGHKVIARNCRVLTVIAAGNVMKVRAVTRSNSEGVKRWVQKSDGRFTVSAALLVNHGNDTCPLRSCVAGASALLSASVIGTDVHPRTYRCDIRNVTQRR